MVVVALPEDDASTLLDAGVRDASTLVDTTEEDKPVTTISLVTGSLTIVELLFDDNLLLSLTGADMTVLDSISSSISKIDDVISGVSIKYSGGSLTSFLT